MYSLLKHYRIKYRTIDPVDGKCFVLFFTILSKNVFINSPRGAHMIFRIFGDVVKFENSV